jgi:hypothetical protein
VELAPNKPPDAFFTVIDKTRRAIRCKRASRYLRLDVDQRDPKERLRNLMRRHRNAAHQTRSVAAGQSAVGRLGWMIHGETDGEVTRFADAQNGSVTFPMALAR